jgi:peroxiredoxin
MIIKRQHWLIASLLFVAAPLMGLAIGAMAGFYLNGHDFDRHGPAVVEQSPLEAATVTLPNGSDVALDEIAPGRVTAIVVMKDATCPVCQRQLRALSQRMDQIQQNGGVVVGLSDASHCTNRALMNRLRLNFPVLSDADHSLLEALNMTLPERDHVMPGVIILDEEGKVETVYKGRSPGQHQEEMILERLRRR